MLLQAWLERQETEETLPLLLCSHLTHTTPCMARSLYLTMIHGEVYRANICCQASRSIYALLLGASARRWATEQHAQAAGGSDGEEQVHLGSSSAVDASSDAIDSSSAASGTEGGETAQRGREEAAASAASSGVEGEREGDEGAAESGPPEDAEGGGEAKQSGREGNVDRDVDRDAEGHVEGDMEEDGGAMSLEAFSHN